MTSRKVPHEKVLIDETPEAAEKLEN